MPDGLYERDALLWSEQQADLLRRLASGERVNDAVDWPNLIEEVEAVGRSELRACESHLELAMRHLLKLQAWPASQAQAHWREEILNALFQAGLAFTPSMRQRIDLPRRYVYALRRAAALQDASGPPRALPAACPFTLEDLLADPVDLDGLLVRLGPAQCESNPGACRAAST